MAIFNKMQMTDFTSWQGLTKDNHIGAIYGKNPQLASNLWIELLALKRGKSLETFLKQFPVKEFETSDEYYWRIKGNSRKNVPIIEARNLSGSVVSSGNLGANKAPFYVVFPEDWFADGNVIVGEKNELYPLRILGSAIMEGTNAVYKVQLMGANMTGVPAEEFNEGKRFSKDFSPVEKELSRGVGEVHFTTGTSMRNEWSRIRIQHKEAGSMFNKKLGVSFPVVDNKTGKTQMFGTWMHNVEYQVECEFADEKNYLIMYGRSNRNSNGEYTDFGKSGNVIAMGAGLREQMEYSNVLYYNVFSLKLIEDALNNLSTSKLDFGNRVFILKTGEYGAIQFHKEVLREVSGWQVFNFRGDALQVMSKVNSELHSTALSAGFQFTEYKAPNGVTVKIEVDPLYDDIVRNKVMHPNGGVAESYRYDIINIGTSDEPNIQLATSKNDLELRGYRWGLRNPFTGQTDNNNMSYTEDSAEIHRMWTGGVFILDPTKTMSIIPSILEY